MAKNSTISHDDAVAVTDFFISTERKIRRKAERKLRRPLNKVEDRKLVEGIDRMIEGQFGFPMRALFEL